VSAAVLPAGTHLSLDPATRRTDAGTVLIGGAPLRMLRLSAAGAEAVRRWENGAAVAQAGPEQALARRLIEAGMAHPRFPAQPNPAVTLVVPVRDNPDGLGRLLGSLGPTGGRLIVVDDGSLEAARVASVAAEHGAEVLRRPVPGGPAAARNTGWQAADTPLVGFVDSDCVARPGWADPLLAWFADPTLAAVGPRVVSCAGRAPRWLADYERARGSLDRGPVGSLVRPRGRVPFLPAAALVVRRAALEELGGFDESMPVGEDVDLVWRAVEAGWTVRYDPEVTVGHEVRPSLRSWLAQRFRYGSSAASLDRRHPRATAPVAVSAWTALAWAMAALGWPVGGASVAAATTVALGGRLGGLEHPWTEAARLAGVGHLRGGALIADGLRRSWWPGLALAMTRSRRARRIAAATLVPLVLEWANGDRRADPWSWMGLRVADDLAYGAGVWFGALGQARWGPLVPDLSNWPGKRPPVEAATGDTDPGGSADRISTARPTG